MVDAGLSSVVLPIRYLAEGKSQRIFVSPAPWYCMALLLGVVRNEVEGIKRDIVADGHAVRAYQSTETRRDSAPVLLKSQEGCRFGDFELLLFCPPILGEQCGVTPRLVTPNSRSVRTHDEAFKD